MPRHVFGDAHEWINEMPTVLSTIARIHSREHINFLPYHVLLASHEGRLTVSKPGRSQKCAWKARTFSEQCGVKTPYYSARNQFERFRGFLELIN